MRGMVEFTDGEFEQIRQWAKKIDGEITLRYATTGHTTDDAFTDYMDRLVDLAPCVRKKKDGDAVVERPTIFVDHRVAYQALPSDRELEPFLMRLENRGLFAEQIPADVQEKLKQLHLPALVKVYITPHCPFCPATVSTLLGLTAVSDQVRLTVIDGELFVDAAQKDRVTAAPTVILDDQFRWTGAINAGELVTMMLDRDPANLGADALRGMIEEGDAEGVAEMMRQRGKIFSSFLELLAHPRWSVRLGAMVAFETLVEEDPELAGQIVEPVTALFANVDDMTKGDLLHVLGESGNKTALPFLKEILHTHRDEEVRSAADEAIEKLNAV
jgi:glutaredoxin